MLSTILIVYSVLKKKKNGMPLSFNIGISGSAQSCVAQRCTISLNLPWANVVCVEHL